MPREINLSKRIQNNIQWRALMSFDLNAFQRDPCEFIYLFCNYEGL